MKTGYFARASEKRHDARKTQVHVVDFFNIPICQYRPHKTMKFCCCAFDIRLPYVECNNCKEKAIKYYRADIH